MKQVAHLFLGRGIDSDISLNGTRYHCVDGRRCRVHGEKGPLSSAA